MKTNSMQKCAIRVGSSLSLLAALSMAISPVSASVGDELENFFDDMGAVSNVTGPTAFEGQRAGYYSGGSLWARFPTENVNPVNLQLPKVSAGCGGIDVFAGSFSFINSDQLVALMKATANNALGFAFQLAIKSISPQIAQTIEELSQKAQMMNQFNMNSCEMAQGLVGGLWGKSDRVSSMICQSVGNSQGLFSDWARSRHKCNQDGTRASTNASNSNPDIPTESINFTWDMLKDSYPGFSREFREYLMTFVGTIVHVQEGDGGENAAFRFIGEGNEEILTALLDGSDSMQVLRCDEPDRCLNPVMTTVSVDGNEALKPRVRTLIESMMSKAQNDGALSEEEIALLGATSIPLYKIISVNAASSFGSLSQENVGNLSEAVAVDLLQSFAARNLGYVTRGVGNFQNVNEEALDQWREQVRFARGTLSEKSADLGRRVETMNTFIERTVFLESTLRASLSPQMSGALAFSTSRTSQAVR